MYYIIKINFMRKKIKLSFEALERELSILSPISMFSILGGTGGPGNGVLENGYCHFNTMGAMLFGDANYGHDVRGDIMDRYGSANNFVNVYEGEGENMKHLGQRYDIYDLERYAKSYGFDAETYDDNFTSQDLQSGLNKINGKVSVFTQSTNQEIGNHAYTLISVNPDGSLVVRDDTNTGRSNFTIQITDVNFAVGVSSDSSITALPPQAPNVTGYDYITTPHDSGYATNYDNITTPHDSGYTTTVYN